MGHKKLIKFAQNETFGCLLQPSAEELLADGYFNLRDHSVKGHWNELMFDKPRPIVLELGCGKGEYTIDLAERNPEFNYIGVDIKGARLWKGAKYATEHSLGNVAFLRTRIEFITAFFAPGEVSEIWLTFSDPQFKSANSRLTSPVFLEKYRSFLAPGGVVHLKTDSRFLYEYSSAVVSANSLRTLAFTTDLYGTPRDVLLQQRFPLETSCSAGPLPSYDGPLPLTLSEAKASSDAPWRPCETEGRERQSGRSQSETSRVARFPEGSAAAVDALYEVQTFYEKMFLKQGYKITYLEFCIDHEGPFVSPEWDEDYWRSVEGPRLLFGHDSAETRRQKLKSE